MLRRTFLQGLGMLFIAPAIVRAESLMPIKELMPPVPDWCPNGWLPLDGREIKKKFYPDLYAVYKKLHFPMQLGNDQGYNPYSGYEEFSIRDMPKHRRIISARDLYRSNGDVMKAGALYNLEIKEGAA